MRIDLFLFKNGYAESRTEAKNFIEGGFVTVNGKAVNKPSYDITESDSVTVDKSGKKYVSRGGLKLEGALNTFGISVVGKLALDVGASSGGFTDCLLQHGAAHVIAIDSGSGQLVKPLRSDSRVTVRENFNARYMSSLDFEYIPELAVMDVSFISSTFILPALHEVLGDGADFICLIKPQFEVGREYVGKGGIVKEEKARTAAVERVISAARNFGFEYIRHTLSPITGGDGNVEFIAHFINRK